MTTVTWLMGFALLSAACGTPESVPAGPAIAAVTGFKDKMCACTSAACATLVTAEMTAWATEKATSGQKAPTLTEKQAKEQKVITDELVACTNKHAGSGSGSATAERP